MDNKAPDGTDHLDDAQLLAREIVQRDEFKRLEEQEPRFRDTTYGVFNGSMALTESWERWWRTHAAARLRGIVGRHFGR
jgi:hypothetical protein